MSTALYRRYRPETFAEVIGQEHVTGPLTAALSKDRINHAYLFSGPRGCGKTTSARILARCLNCAQGPTATPCGVCDSCRDLARGGPGSLDVVEIDAASHGGVDDARSLRERAVFAPARDRFKVFIIDEAHMVSTQGFNALLKIVEEPPPHIRFVFATTEPDKVIGTIRSRTHHYPFRLVPPERLQNYLGELCSAEGVEVGQGVLPLVVRAGAGSVRDSLSVLDQLIAGAGAEGLTYNLAVSLLGYTDATLLDDVVDGLAVGDGATVFQVVDRVIESGHDPRRFVEDLLERLRDLLVVAAVPDGGHAVLRALPADQLRRMQEQAGRFGKAELSRAADVVNTALTEMTGATSPRLQLELLCARLLLPAAEDAERGLRARVDRIEKRLGVVTPGQPLASPSAETAREALRPEPARPAERPADRADDRGGDRASGPPADWRGGRPAVRDGEPAAGPAPRPARPMDGGTAAPDGAPPPAGGAAPGREPDDPGTPQAGSAGPVQQAPGGRVDGAPEVTAATPPSAPSRGGPDTATVRRLWPDVLTALSGLKRATWTLVSTHANVLEYDGQRLLLGFGSDGLVKAFMRGANAEFLRQALIEVLGLDCAIEAVAGDRGSIRAPQAPSGPPTPSGPPLDRAPDRPADLQPERQAERQPERQPERRPEQPPERPTDPASEHRAAQPGSGPEGAGRSHAPAQPSPAAHPETQTPSAATAQEAPAQDAPDDVTPAAAGDEPPGWGASSWSADATAPADEPPGWGASSWSADAPAQAAPPAQEPPGWGAATDAAPAAGRPASGGGDDDPAAPAEPPGWGDTPITRTTESGAAAPPAGGTRGATDDGRATSGASARRPGAATTGRPDVEDRGAARPDAAGRPDAEGPGTPRPGDRGPGGSSSRGGSPSRGGPSRGSSSRGGSSRGSAVADPYADADIPIPDEPPVGEDEVPPEDAGFRGRPAPRADQSSRPTAPAAQAATAAAPGAPSAPARTAGAPRPESTRPGHRGATAPGQRPEPARAVTSLRDDEVSLDDADIEDSSLVGAPVVEQLLGGRLIDEREE